MSTTLTAGGIKSNSHRWLIIVTIMLVAILEVLDSTIVNVALPAMMPALGADQSSITWVLTSYVVASAMMLPLTGFLSSRVGQKRLLFINISGFLISSFLSGLSTSLAMMVVFRFFQGAFGALLIPLSQSILRETFPPKEQGKAMAIWGIGIMAAPVFGPTLGGFITEHSSWRWVFYINVPVCIIGMLLTLFTIPKSTPTKQKIDWLGMLLMFIGIGSLQIFLDKGNENSWFASNFILLLCIVSIFALSFFIIRSAYHKHPVISLPIFKNRNFTLSTICLALFAGSVFGLITLQPIMLENLFGYTAILAGKTMAPLGIASAIAMMISSQLMLRINVKTILFAAIAFCAFGAWYFAHLSAQTNQAHFLFANSITGFGMGLFMVPLSTYSLFTLNKKDITEGAGLFSYGRMLGTSIGISLLSTLVTRVTQLNWNQLGGHLRATSEPVHVWLRNQHLTLHSTQMPALLGKQLLHQSNLLAFNDAYYAVACTFVILIPIVLCMKTVSIDDTASMGH